jgi:ATP-dependent Clp protease ATP-binding subunit ClpC
VFERFTERARQVVVLAQEEARALGHDYVGTEHLLLGLLREEEGLGARVLESLHVSIDEARAQVARIVGRGEGATTGQAPFRPRAKKVLELSLREALALGHNYIGTEHILLGLAREDGGVAAKVLLAFGIDSDAIRGRVVELLGGEIGGLPPKLGTTNPRLSPSEARGPRPGHGLSPLLVGWALGAGTLGLGILVGWAIWG